MKDKIIHFFRSEPAAGIVLMVAAAVGIFLANSGQASAYFALLETHVAGLSVLHWINDGLMAVFFLYVGLEVKRELLQGELNTNAKRVLPGLAALAGLAVPAVIYLTLNGFSSESSRGWAIPTATDIAFALGVLALLGSRIPASLKIFLTALAIMDDLAAIVVIALFYTAKLQVAYLMGAGAIVLLLSALNLRGVLSSKPYLILGATLWFLVLKSGIHATLAGVVLAFTIPLRVYDSVKEAPLLTWEHGLSNWVSFLVIPIFGLANAGVSFAGFSLEWLTEPIVIGITLGLVIGKQLGIFGLVWLLVKTKLVALPDKASWLQVYGVALLCGIGFTMSLFISLLAFDDVAWQNFSKVGVFMGSIISGIAGYLVLRFAPSKVSGKVAE